MNANLLKWNCRDYWNFLHPIRDWTRDVLVSIPQQQVTLKLRGWKPTHYLTVLWARNPVLAFWVLRLWMSPQAAVRLQLEFIFHWRCSWGRDQADSCSFLALPTWASPWTCVLRWCWLHPGHTVQVSKRGPHAGSQIFLWLNFSSEWHPITSALFCSLRSKLLIYSSEAP